MKLKLFVLSVMMTALFWNQATADNCGTCDSTNVNATCKVTCEEGQILEGLAEVVCIDPGEWNGTHENCTNITCDNITSPEGSSSKDCTGMIYGDTCNITCKDGFYMEGNSTRECWGDGSSTNGTWNGTEVTCTQIICPSIEQPDSGCNGCQESNFGDECTITCDTGYYLEGDSNRTCGGDYSSVNGTWNGTDVTCIQIICDDIYAPTNSSSENCTNMVYGDECTITCDNGFYLEGDSVRTCGGDHSSENGIWSGTDVTCEQIICPSIEQPDSGSNGCQESNFGDECTITCDTGYFLEGDSNRTCGGDYTSTNGSWNGTEVTCTQIICPSIEQPDSGSNGCQESNFGDECTITCDTGYYLEGDSNRTCGGDYTSTNGSWNGTEVTCTQITCSSISQPDNAENGCTESNFGDLCTIECNEGFYLEGDSDHTCSGDGTSTDGTWTGQDVTCTHFNVLQIDSNDMKAIKDDSFTFEVRLTCSLGNANDCNSNVTIVHPNNNSRNNFTQVMGSGTTKIFYTRDIADEQDEGMYNITSTGLHEGQEISDSVTLNIILNIRPENLEITYNAAGELTNSHLVYIRGSTDTEVECSADGNPDPSYNWGYDSNHSTISSNHGMLNLSNAYFSDSDQYHCNASNYVGEENILASITGWINITIEGAPVPIAEGDIKPGLKDNLELICMVDALPLAGFTWKENSDELSNNNFANTSNLEADGYSSGSTAIMNYVLCKGPSIILCNASNKHGNNSVQFEINKKDKYSIHKDNYFVFPSSKKNWEESTEYCNASLGYLVIIKNSDTNAYLSEQWNSTEEDEYLIGLRNTSDGWIWSDGSMYNATEFDNWDENSDSNGACVVATRGSLWQWTKAESSGTPEDLTLKTETCNGKRLNVTWSSENVFSSYNYVIHYSALNGSHSDNVIVTTEAKSFNDMQPNTEYSIKVSSGHGYCELHPWDINTVVTGWTTPEDINSASLNQDCNLTWVHSSKYAWQSDYMILWEEVSLNNDEVKVVKNTTLPASERSFLLEQNPNSKYTASIQAISCAGESTIFSAENSCETSQSAPEIVKAPSSAPGGDVDSSKGIPVQVVESDERNGAVSCYFVAVIYYEESPQEDVPIVTDQTSFDQFSDNTIMNEKGFSYLSHALNRDDFKNSTVDLFIGVYNETTSCAIERASNRMRRQTTSNVVSTNNTALESSKYYFYYVITATASSDGNIYYASSEVSTEVHVISVPACGTGCILGIVFGVLALVAIVIVAILWYRRQKSKPKSNNKQHKKKKGEVVKMTQLADGEDNQSYENILSVIYSNRLENEYFRKFTFDGEKNLYAYEYEGLKEEVKRRNIDCSYASEEQNREFNRFRNILPANQYRVVLNTKPGDDLTCDYINASYIPGYKTTQPKYIASQGPLPNTIEHFWKMIWQEKSCVIVMLTNIDEDGKRKCEKYWPSDKEMEQYGNLIITAKNSSTIGNIVMRTFDVAEDLSPHLTRKVTQFHYKTWPDHGVPTTTTTLLQLRKLVNEEQGTDTAPIVVHCSAGCGRTGTYIALDTLIEQLERESLIDVRSLVINLRKRRTEMIQTLDQYIYVHKLLYEDFFLGDTDFTTSEFEEKVQHIATHPDFDGLTTDFEYFDKTPPLHRSQKTALTKENASLNRDKDCLPYDSTLVKLKKRNETDEPPYINASFITGYDTTRCNFIATQDPLPDTIEHFWRLVLDQNVKCIVMIEEENSTVEPCAEYWAKLGTVLRVGNVEVQLESSTTEYDNVEYTFEVKEFGLEINRSATVKQIVYDSKWPEEANVTTDVADLLNLVKQIENIRRNCDGQSAPVVIHYGNGSDRIGCICAFTNLMERVKTENKVDIFRCVKDLRDQRPNLIKDMNEFRLCYAAVNCYMKEFDALPKIHNTQA